MPCAAHALSRAYARARAHLFANAAEEEIARIVAEAHAEMDAQREREALWADLVEYAKAGELRPAKEPNA